MFWLKGNKMLMSGTTLRYKHTRTEVLKPEFYDVF
jgi:hypothetical protein